MAVIRPVKRPAFPADSMAPYSQQLLNWLARHQVNTAIAPAEQAITNQRTALRRDTTDRSNALSHAYAAAAQMLEGAPKNIEGIYGRAADSIAGYARGVADIGAGEQQTAGGAAGSNPAATLSPEGMAAIKASYQSNPNVTAGIYGYIPASSLAREGAGFAAAAELQPDVTRAAGRDALKSMMYKQGQDDSDLAKQIADIEARRPGLLDQAYTSLYQGENAKAATRTQRGYLQLQTAKTAEDQALALTDMYGYMFKADKNGRVAPVLVNGHVIPAPGSDAAVAITNAKTKKAGPANKAKDRRAKAVEARNTAISDAKNWVFTQQEAFAGAPTENPRFGKDPGLFGDDTSMFKYLKPNGKGTNDRTQAARDGGISYSKALNQVVSYVTPDLRQYGVKPAAIRQMASQWLRGIGITPKPAVTKTTTKKRGKGVPNFSAVGVLTGQKPRGVSVPSASGLFG